MHTVCGRHVFRCLKRAVNDQHHVATTSVLGVPPRQSLSKATKASPSSRTPRQRSKLSGLMKPSVIPSQFPTGADEHVGLDLVGPLDKAQIITVLNEFFRRPEALSISMDQGMEYKVYQTVFADFRRFCATTIPLPTDLHIKLSDLIQGHGAAIDLYPFFLRHAKTMFPHLECVEDLRYVSDLSKPANWFASARAKSRKIVIHAGPTNSGKTYHAFQRYLNSKSGIYCGPLKMLAVEIAQKSNAVGIACDLITGEERNLADPEGKRQAAHVSCTVEMTDIERNIEVAIIDEIQMLRDPQRGWAWLRAFLGVNADEVHICGEAAVIDIIKELALDTGDSVEVRRYERLTPIEYMNESVETIANVQDGDCIVCFSKSQIYGLCRELEKNNKQCAVIYGGLPPGTKLAQASRFNDPEDPCKVLVATDAIGMGLNLNIRRIIFYSLTKLVYNNGVKDVALISPSQALQIAGRSGRFGTTHKDKGYVTTFHSRDLETMHSLLQSQINPITKAGIHPTPDQIELFGYYLPNASLPNIIEIFTTMMTMDGDKYFLCDLDQFRQIAGVIDHIQMPLRSRYVFCCAPIPLQSAFVTTSLLKYTRRFSDGQPVTIQWLKDRIDWPLPTPCTLNDLTHLEAVHDSLDLYNWLSYRFQDQFPDREMVKEMKLIIDEQITEGVLEITRLVNAETSDTGASNNHSKSDAKDKRKKQGVSRLRKKISRQRVDDKLDGNDAM